MKSLTESLLTILAGAIVFQSAPAATNPSFKEPLYKSARPLYFRLVFGVGEEKQMLGVFDESKGTGKGYDSVYLDYDADGDLKESRPIKFPEASDRMKQRGMKFDPKFTFNGSLNKKSAKYTLSSYSFGRPNGGNPATFNCTIEAGRWRYRFINGKLNLYHSAYEAVKGKPYYIAGNITWDLKSPRRGVVSVAIKDKNGGTLRSVRKGDERLTPQLSLYSGRKPVLKSKMGFG